MIVFISGESYDWDAGNPYDGSVLSSFGQVIVVTLNYRLGVLGMTFINYILCLIVFCYDVYHFTNLLNILSTLLSLFIIINNLLPSSLATNDVSLTSEGEDSFGLFLGKMKEKVKIK